METIINLCDYDVVLRRDGYLPKKFPRKEEAPVACMLASRMPRPKGSLISDVQWSDVNLHVLPPMREGTFYIVPLEFAVAVGRSDLLIPFKGHPSANGDEVHTFALVRLKDALPPKREIAPEELIAKVREIRVRRPGEGLYFIKRALELNDYDLDRAEAWLIKENP